MMKEVRYKLDDFRKILGNAKMAYMTINPDIDCKNVVKSIFELLEENFDNIKRANEIDIKNNNGFKIELNLFQQLKNNILKLDDLYRKVIYMNKLDSNYIEGKQTDNLGTISLIYDGNTYCLLDVVLKAILTHNSIIICSDSNYMNATNELIVILIKRILDAYKIDKNLIQILYTSRFGELLSNSVSINKVIVIGDKRLQENIKNISKIETICFGYDNYDIYIEDETNIELIHKILNNNSNVDVYVKSGISIEMDNVIEVLDIDEAIAQINYNTSGYSSSIFTNNPQNGAQFLREVNTKNVSVNSSPLIEGLIDLDINLLICTKKMIYPSPLSNNLKNNRIEFPTLKGLIKDNIIEENDEELRKLQKENLNLQQNNKKIEEVASEKIKQKDEEIKNLQKQLEESQKMAKKYINIFKNSFLSRLFGKLTKKEIEKDIKLLH